MTGLNRDTGGTSQRRGVHGDPWRRTGTHGDHRAAPDTPLGDLIAGRIDQATYRRRMADLERRAADSLDVEPAPARRRAPDHERSGAGCVWVAVALVLALTLALGVLVGSCIAAPRGAQTTDLVPPPRDMSASAFGVSSAGLPGAPHVGGSLDPRKGNQTGATGDGGSASRGPTTGGASPTETRTQALGDMVAAQVSRLGDISHMGDYPVPRSYLALPCQRDGVHCGLLVRLCGPADCRVMRQTDYGPSQRQHPDRIADVHPAVFEALCGVPARLGLCPGTWTAVTPTLPPTDEP